MRRWDVDTHEPCDDGNAANGDGCSADCQVELCFQCAGNPSVCTPLADGSACDDGNPCTTAACDGSGACVVSSVVIATMCAQPCTLDSCDPGLDACTR
jgi:cysteine-rich repeat protein